jgi:hypothetical protein
MFKVLFTFQINILYFRHDDCISHSASLKNVFLCGLCKSLELLTAYLTKKMAFQGAKVVRNFQIFMAPESLLSYSKYSATCSYPEPDKLSLPTYFFTIQFILFSPLHLDLTSRLFHPGFLNRTLYALLFFPFLVACPPHLILFDIISPFVL